MTDDMKRKRDEIFSYHGCLTGACPHEKQAECFAAIFDEGVIAGREGYVTEASVEQELQSCQIAMREYDAFRSKLKSEYVPLSVGKLKIPPYDQRGWVPLSEFQKLITTVLETYLHNYIEPLNKKLDKAIEALKEIRNLDVKFAYEAVMDWDEVQRIAKQALKEIEK